MMRKWWKEAVVYQIYPRSFYDSNGDGIGDIPGIIEKLDYIADLGVDAVWLSPVYKSPNEDNGYDISDYRDISPEFGTMADMERLIQEAHARNLRVMMDLVVNHTSDRHPWFLESRSAKDSPMRDFYIWRPGKGQLEPNNWRSIFGGSAWEYDEQTGEYYLHVFAKGQPDLNWDNPKVRNEICNIARWWLEKGVDGFRLDAISLISKVPGLPDAPVEPGERYADGRQYFRHGPRVHEFLQEISERVFQKYGAVTVGETTGVTPEMALEYVAEERNELDLIFHSELMELDCYPGNAWKSRDWKLTDLKQVVEKWDRALRNRAWNTVFLGNHDQPRAVSRFGNDTYYRKESAKLLATLLLTLPGTPFLYQGDEIGMTNIKLPGIDDYRDIATLNIYREKRNAGVPRREIMAAIWRASRDNARTPMQWTPELNGGFSSGRPWLAVNANYPDVNVAKELAEPDSILHYYRRLLRFRRSNLELIYGEYRTLLSQDEHIYAYVRQHDGIRFTIVLNFSEDEIPIPPALHGLGQLVLGNYSDCQSATEYDVLRPYEARIYKQS